MHQTSSSPSPPKHTQRHNFFSRSVPKLLSPQPQLQPEKIACAFLLSPQDFLSSFLAPDPFQFLMFHLFLSSSFLFAAWSFVSSLSSETLCLYICTCNISKSLNSYHFTTIHSYFILACPEPKQPFLSNSLFHCGFNATLFLFLRSPYSSIRSTPPPVFPLFPVKSPPSSPWSGFLFFSLESWP